MKKVLSLLLCLALLTTFVPVLGEEAQPQAETPAVETVEIPEETPAEEPIIDEASTEEDPVEEAPAEVPPVEEAPAEEAEPAPADEAPVGEAPAEEAPVTAEPTAAPETPEVPEAGETPEAPVEEAPAEEAAPAEEVLQEEAASSTVDYDGLIVEDGVAINYTGSSSVVEIPSGVKEIGYRCFYYSWVTEVKIPSTVKEISEEAFAWSSLERVTIPSSVRALMKRSFYQCASLKTVNIQGCMGGIGEEAFMYSGVQNLTLNDNISFFSTRCFAYTNIKRLWLPENVETLKKGAFQGITTMTELYIPPNYQDSEECLTLDVNKSILTVYGYSGTFAETFGNRCKAFVCLDSKPNLNSVSASATATPPGVLVTFTAVTPSAAKYLGLFAESGKLVKYWKASGNSTVNDHLRTWKVTYAIANTGSRTLTFKCSSGGQYGNGKQVKILVTNSLPAVVSASANVSSVAAKQPVTFTVKTPTDAKFLALFSENGTKVKVWGRTGNSSVSGSYRVWKVQYSISTPGNRKLGFRCAKSSSYGSGKTVSIQVTAPAPKVTYFDVDYNIFVYPAVAQMCPQHWLVTTEPHAQYLRLYSGSTVVKTWKADEYAFYHESDNELYWQVDYRVMTGGTRKLTMKASVDGSTYGPGYDQTFVYDTPTKLSKGSTARGSLLEPYTYVYYMFTPAASGTFTFYSAGSADLDATLYDDEYDSIASSFGNWSSGDTMNFEFPVELERGKNYFLEVSLMDAYSDGGTFRIGVK